MSSYCCSSSGFLQSDYTVLLSGFLLPFSCTFWCCCSLPCISPILQVHVFSFTVLSFCRTDPEFPQWLRFFPPLTMFAKDLTGCFSHCCVEGGDHWVQVFFIVHDGERCTFPAYDSLKGFQHIRIFQLFEVNTRVLGVLACWFFPDEDGRSSSASRGHFQCLLSENFVFWHCSLLIGGAYSLECNKSGCGVVHLG